MVQFYIEPRRVTVETVSDSVPALERISFCSLIEKLDWEDVLVVTKLDCLGRHAMDVRATAEWLAEMQVRVHRLALGETDLTSTAGRMTISVIAAVAEFERDLLTERTHANLVGAKAQGKKLGRPSSLTKEHQEAVRLQRSQGVSLGVLGKTCGVTRSAIQRVERRF